MSVRFNKNNLSFYLVIESSSLVTFDQNEMSKWRFVAKSIEDYWRVNVDRFFSHSNHYRIGRWSKSRNQGNLSSAFTVLYDNKNGRIIGQINASKAPYIKYLIYGIHESKGAYVPSLGERIRAGKHKGFSNLYWMAWESNFKIFIDNLVIPTLSRSRRVKKRKVRPMYDYRQCNRDVRNHARSSFVRFSQ